MAEIKRKFVVTTLAGTREVFPINGNELVYAYKRDKSIVNFIKELKTNLIFCNNAKTGNNDFDFFFSYENDVSKRCEDITCDIYKTCNGVDILEFTGIIPLISGEWNLDRCEVSLKLEPQFSIYDKINRYKKETELPIARECPLGGGDPATNDSGAFYLYDTSSGNNVYMRIKKFDAGAYSYSYKTDTYSAPNVKYPYGLFASLCYIVVQELLFKCGKTSGEYLRSDFFDWNAKGDTPGYVASPMTKLNLNMPSSNYPFGKYTNRYIFLPLTAGTNYFTGETNKLTHLLYMPKSNANDNGASNWEADTDTDGFNNGNRLTFEEIEQIWATCFQAYWFIDTDGCMRVEHESWFDLYSNIYDTTIGEQVKWNKSNRKFTFKDDSIFRKEIFKYSANRDVLNGKVETEFPNKNNEILYESVCVNTQRSSGEKEYTLTKITTDIQSLDSKNTGLSEYYDVRGIVLFACEFSLPYNVRPLAGFPYYYVGQVDATCPSETLLNTTSPTTYVNGHLQWANLIRRYLKNKRMLSVGINGSDSINFTAKTVKTKLQKDVIYKICCDEDFEPKNAIIKTELGNGDIDDAEYNTKTNLIKINTLHD